MFLYQAESASCLLPPGVVVSAGYFTLCIPVLIVIAIHNNQCASFVSFNVGHAQNIHSQQAENKGNPKRKPMMHPKSNSFHLVATFNIINKRRSNRRPSLLCPSFPLHHYIGVLNFKTIWIFSGDNVIRLSLGKLFWLTFCKWSNGLLIISHQFLNKWRRRQTMGLLGRGFKSHTHHNKLFQTFPMIELEKYSPRHTQEMEPLGY